MKPNLQQILRKLSYAFSRRRNGRELAEELASHREMLERDLREGRDSHEIDPTRRLGNVTLAAEQSRDVWTFQPLASVGKDVKHAVRGLIRTPVFTAIAVASLALGIGANTAIFSFVDAILLKRLAVPEPDRLFRIGEIDRDGAASERVLRLPAIQELAKRDTAFSGVFGWFPKQINFSRGDSAQWLLGELVTGQYFQTLRLHPVLGRFFNEEDIRTAIANPVCVISYDFWQNQLGGDPSVLRQKIFLNGHPYQILGVTERGFHGAALQRRASLQIPATRIADFMPAFGEGTGVNWLKTLSWLSPMARLKPGVAVVEAQHRTKQLLDPIEAEGRKNPIADQQRDLLLQDGSQGFNAVQSFGQPLVVLMGVAGLVLLAACANLANLLLARAQSRTQEFAVRLSIGASRFRLVRQLLIESLVIAAVGGALGLLLSLSITRTLEAFLNTGRSSLSAIQAKPDGTVLAFSLVLSFATALIFGLLPAWHSTRLNLVSGLKQESNSSDNRQGVSLRRLLVVFQIALSLVVIFAAGLLTRTLRTLQTLDLGFRPDRVIALSIDPAANGYANAEIPRVFDQVLERARALPSVKAASTAVTTPGGSDELSLSIEVPGYTPKRNGDDVAIFNSVSPGYFATIGQPLLRGRDFATSDGNTAPRVAIVNQQFARKFWPGQDVIGRKFKQGDGDVEIVGLVRDVRDHGLRSGPKDIVFLSEKQSQNSGLTILVRTDQEPTRTIASLLAIVRSIDKRLPVTSVHTLDTEIESGLSSERILGYLSSLFAALATLLAGIGLYGVLAYSILRRRREIGIRLAVGAQRQDIGLLFARESLSLVLLGLVIGGPAALASVRMLKSLLFGVTTTDLSTLTLSILVLAGAALLASTVPLWRATRTDPTSALRSE